MGKYTFLNMIQDILNSAKSPLTVSEIWDIVQANNLLDKVGSKGATPIESIKSVLYVNSKREDSCFYVASRIPTRFGIRLKKEKYVLGKNETQKEKDKRVNYSERSLHELLVNFVRNDERFGIYCKTIDDKKSTKGKKGINQWIHPDIVGVHYPCDFQKETSELLVNFGKMPYKLYSFELKTVLTLDNFKEYYFQAVSNSSWANEGYLVFMDCCDREDLFSELARLNQAFGIGVIQLNARELPESQVVFSAKPKDEVDFRTLDLLVLKNKDFQEFIKSINRNIKVLDFEYIDENGCDLVLEGEELEKHIKENNIL